MQRLHFLRPQEVQCLRETSLINYLFFVGNFYESANALFVLQKEILTRLSLDASFFFKVAAALAHWKR